MQFYVAVRPRCAIDSKWLDWELLESNKSGPGAIYGPFVTVYDSEEQYEKVLDCVDDEDYGIFVRDDRKQWWRVQPYRSGRCRYRRMQSLEWHETLTAIVGLSIEVESNIRERVKKG